MIDDLVLLGAVSRRVFETEGDEAGASMLRRSMGACSDAGLIPKESKTFYDALEFDALGATINGDLVSRRRSPRSRRNY